jgi:hypothetical protein
LQGDYVAYRFPRLNNDGLLEDSQRSSDGQVINLRARGGTPSTQFRPELIPFDYTDFETQIAGGVICAETSSKHSITPGIADMPFEDFFKCDGIAEARACSAEQETSSGYKYGDLGKVFAGVESLAKYGYVTINPAGARAAAAASASATPAALLATAAAVERLAADIGTWSTTLADQTVVHDILNNIYFRDLPQSNTKAVAAANSLGALAGTPLSKIATTWIKRGVDKAAYEKACYLKLRVLLSHFANAALVGSWFSKTTKIIGRSMNTATPADTLHVLAG